MAEDVELPAVGKVKREHLMVAGALTLGIVGAMWYRARAGGGGGEAPAVDPSDMVGADREPMDPGGGSGSVDSTDPNVPDTNAEWTQAATEYLSNIGYEPALVATALGKYLGRQQLAATEANVVRAAVGAFGPPPTGGPYSILLGMPTPAPSPMTAQITLTSQPPATVNQGSSIEFRGRVLVNKRGNHQRVIVKYRNAGKGAWISYPTTLYSDSNGAFRLRISAARTRDYAFIAGKDIAYSRLVKVRAKKK